MIVKIKRGLKQNLPMYAEAGELLYTIDENCLYVGLGSENPIKKLSDLSIIPNNKQLLDKFTNDNGQLQFNGGNIIIDNPNNLETESKQVVNSINEVFNKVSTLENVLVLKSSDSSSWEQTSLNTWGELSTYNVKWGELNEI